MKSFPPVRKQWTTSRLNKFVPEPALVRLILRANGVPDVPPGLRHLTDEKA